MMSGIRATVRTVSGSTVRNAEFTSRWSETVQVILGKKAEAVQPGECSKVLSNAFSTAAAWGAAENSIVMVTNHLLPRQLLILICDCHDEQHNINSDPRDYKHS